MSKHNRGRQNQQQRNPNRPIELIVREPYYTQIDKGEKTIEGRVAYPWLDRAKEGMSLNFKRYPQDPRIIRCVIDWVMRSPDFENALLDVEWQKAIPEVERFDDALAIYEKIYPEEKVKEIGGVIMLGFTKQGVTGEGGDNA